MPVENLEDEGLPKNPNLELAAWRFTLNNPEGKDKEDAKKRLMDAIKENGMSRLFCALFISITRSHVERTLRCHGSKKFCCCLFVRRLGNQGSYQGNKDFFK